ncbi:uncharacterized protein LOC108906385 [Anoplophora glabripennis]|uniref:uncharacterized protein LOC108906385 n=1 Tax=Anoplophora glabripennis TaxID=217634 RepID=UPI0008736D7A|nr:uncharacterized protein LOC108906385 [Anoplophora glabripennis]
MDQISQLRTERFHQSVPVLDTEQCSEVGYRAKRTTKWRRRGDAAMIHTISVFYAKILVILGIALPVTDAIATSNHDTFDGFYVYLYVGSILFLLYMYVIQVKEKSIQERWLYTAYQEGSNEPNEGQRLKRNSHVRYGSFYFRMGVTGFGIGSVIYSALQFGEYWELSSEGDCDNLLKAIKPMLRIVFVLMEMLFIFSHTNFLGVMRSKFIANFGLMHMIATNLCEWFYVLVLDTKGDIYRSAQKRQQIAARDNQTLSTGDFQFINSNSFLITKNFYEHKSNCMQSNIMEPILTKVQGFLSPCTVEYSLLCAVILALMWKNNCANDGEREATQDLSTEISGQSGCNVIYGRSHSQFSVDCAQAHKGLFSGILALAVTIISLIMFFELVGYKEFKDATVFQVNVWEAILFWTATIAAVSCMAALRDISFVKEKRGLELEHLLLLVTQSGLFMYFLFQIIGGFLMGTKKGKGGIMRIITPLSALIQSCCQTVLVFDAWRRRCRTETQMRKKPGRQLITFLLVINICLWIVNRLKNNRSVSHPNQMDFYGILSWNIITHVSMPLVVSYRFQSTVCFYEIWKHVYKMRPVKGELSDCEDDQ